MSKPKNNDVEKAGSFLVRHFSVVGIPVVILIGLVISFFVTKQTEEIMFKSYADVTASNVNSFLSAELALEDFSEPMNGKRLADFQRLLRKHSISKDILKSKLWNTDGMVVYSSDRRLIGKKYPIKKNLVDSLNGYTTREIVNTEQAVENRLDREQFSSAVEIYVPVKIKGVGKIVGSYEVYFSTKQVMKALNRVRFLVFSALLVLYVLLIFIVRWASALLIAQYNKLADFSNIMHSQAITDELTNLNNRRYFDDRITEEFRRALRYKRPLSLVLLDLDHFKWVNDQLGHQLGDEVLAKTASLIKANLRNVDIAARYGGEEFAIIMPETSGENAFLVAERLREVYLSILNEYRNDDLPLTISIGIAEHPQSAISTEDLIAAADKALYYAKKKGRNQSHLFDELPEEAKKAKVPARAS